MPYLLVKIFPIPEMTMNGVFATIQKQQYIDWDLKMKPVQILGDFIVKFMILVKVISIGW